MLNFDTLFALMEQELPVITVDTHYEDTFAWESRYHDDDRQVFLERLAHAVMVIAQEDGHEHKGSYHITDLDRARVRAAFEESLAYGLAEPEIGYTDRDKELVSEYFRMNAAPLESKSHEPLSDIW